jgi:hypothetical protein
LAFLRFSRDKRGYENFYLVETITNRRGKTRARVLYWFRTPPGVKVGREPFDLEIRRALEAQNPNVVFDWRKISETPIPSADAEKWRERRRLERATRARRRDLAPSGGEPADAEAVAEGLHEGIASEDDSDETSLVEGEETIESGEALAAEVFGRGEPRADEPGDRNEAPTDAIGSTSESVDADASASSNRRRKRRRHRGRRRPELTGSPRSTDAQIEPESKEPSEESPSSESSDLRRSDEV